MVKKRLLFLVVIYVACSSVLSNDEETAPVDPSFDVAQVEQTDQVIDVAPPPPPPPRRKKQKKATEAPLSCRSRLVAEEAECLNNVDPQYDPKTCVFNIKEKDCSYDCSCQEYATTEAPKQRKKQRKSDGSSSGESCEFDKKIEYANEAISVQGSFKRVKCEGC